MALERLNQSRNSRVGRRPKISKGPGGTTPATISHPEHDVNAWQAIQIFYERYP